MWNSKIELSEKFFNEIIRHPVPLDMNTLTALKRCSLGLDLYLWLVYRTFPLRAVQQITWKQMYRQFGLHSSKASDKKTVLNFRVKILRELKKIKLAWPELNYSTAPGVLILLPSVPAITPGGSVATAGPIALRKPQERRNVAVLRVRGEMAEFYGKKADNPHRGRRQGDPCDLRQPRQVFAMRGLPLQV